MKEEIETVFDSKVAGVMPLSEDLVELGSADIISLLMPNHPWSKAITSVAKTIMETN